MATLSRCHCWQEGQEQQQVHHSPGGKGAENKTERCARRRGLKVCSEWGHRSQPDPLSSQLSKHICLQLHPSSLLEPLLVLPRPRLDPHGHQGLEFKKKVGCVQSPNLGVNISFTLNHSIQDDHGPKRLASFLPHEILSGEIQNRVHGVYGGGDQPLKHFKGTSYLLWKTERGGGRERGRNWQKHEHREMKQAFLF